MTHSCRHRMKKIVKVKWREVFNCKLEVRNGGPIICKLKSQTAKSQWRKKRRKEKKISMGKFSTSFTMNDLPLSDQGKSFFEVKKVDFFLFFFFFLDKIKASEKKSLTFTLLNVPLKFEKYFWFTGPIEVHVCVCYESHWCVTLVKSHSRKWNVFLLLLLLYVSKTVEIKRKRRRNMPVTRQSVQSGILT